MPMRPSSPVLPISNAMPYPDDSFDAQAAGPRVWELSVDDGPRNPREKRAGLLYGAALICELRRNADF